MSVQVGKRPLEAYILNVAPQRQEPLLEVVLDGRSRITEAFQASVLAPGTWSFSLLSRKAASHTLRREREGGGSARV